MHEDGRLTTAATRNREAAGVRFVFIHPYVCLLVLVIARRSSRAPSGYPMIVLISNKNGPVDWNDILDHDDPMHKASTTWRVWPRRGAQELPVAVATIALAHTQTEVVGDVHENGAQNCTAAPRLKAAMNRFVVRIALREHVPLRAGVEYPKRPFKNLACRDRPAARPPVRNVFFGKVMANPLPLQIAQPNHSTFIADRQPSAILR
jgi:hypothetical protein